MNLWNIKYTDVIIYLILNCIVSSWLIRKLISLSQDEIKLIVNRFLISIFNI